METPQQYLTPDLLAVLGIKGPTAIDVPMVFVDTETTGLGWHEPIWEIAAIRRVRGEPDVEDQAFVEHDPVTAAGLPDRFRADHDRRYDPSSALSVARLAEVARPTGTTKPVLLGAVPAFDAIRLRVQFGVGPWHYRWLCVETMAWTALHMRTPVTDPATLPGDGDRSLGLPWSSDELAQAVGVPAVSDAQGRHTALGDARWARDIFDAVMATRPRLGPDQAAGEVSAGGPVEPGFGDPRRMAR